MEVVNSGQKKKKTDRSGKNLTLQKGISKLLQNVPRPTLLHGSTSNST